MKKNSIIVLALTAACVVAGLLAGTGCEADPPPAARAMPPEAVVSDSPSLGTTVTPGRERSARLLLAAAEKADTLAGVAIDYPQNGAIFPPDFPSPMVVWHDASEEADAWLVEVTLADRAGRICILTAAEPLAILAPGNETGNETGAP